MRAEDSLGNWGEHAYSDGTTIYLSPPSAMSNSPIDKGDWTNINNDWQWSPETPSSFYGLNGQYNLKLRKSDGTIVLNQRTNGNFWRFTGSEDGETYYGQVAAVDVEGFVGDYGPLSDGVRADISAPVRPPKAKEKNR